MITKDRTAIEVIDYDEVSSIYENEIGPDSTILELGCGIPFNLFDSHIFYDCKRLIGVDIMLDEKKIIERYQQLDGGEMFEGFNNLREIHEAYILDLAEEGQISTDQVKPLVGEYEHVYTIITDYDLATRNLTELGKADFIYLVDVLHFIDHKKSKEIIEQIPHLLTDNGVVVIKAHHQQNAGMTEPEDTERIGEGIYKSKVTLETAYLFDEDRFLELINVLEQNEIVPIIVAEKHRDSKSKNSRYESMLYIGRKNRIQVSP